MDNPLVLGGLIALVVALVVVLMVVLLRGIYNLGYHQGQFDANVDWFERLAKDLHPSRFRPESIPMPESPDRRNPQEDDVPTKIPADWDKGIG